MKRRCFCGKTTRSAKCCEQLGLFSCGKRCEKPLPHCRHVCKKVCHDGACDERCEESVRVQCKCGKRKGEEVCWKVQGMKGYDARLHVQVVLECNEECGVAQVTEEKQVEKKSHSIILVSVLVVLIAVLFGLWFQFHYSVCIKHNQGCYSYGISLQPFPSNTTVFIKHITTKTNQLSARSRRVGGGDVRVII